MKALTIREPWAWAILWAGKDVENRTWLPTAKQLEPGERFAIHAATKPVDDWSAALERITAIVGTDFELPMPRFEDMARGAIVGTARLLELPDEQPESAWAEPNALWWRLADVRPIQPPEPCRGGQGLWTVPTTVLEAIRERDEGGADMAARRKKRQERFPADDVDPEELESLTKELSERVAELSAMVKLARVTKETEEAIRQIARVGIRSHELSDRVKDFAGALNLESAT